MKPNNSINNSTKEHESDLVPLMYQAKTEDRGKIQYAKKSEREKVSNSERWLQQWLDGCGCPPVLDPSPSGGNKATQRGKRQNLAKMPQFGPDVHTWEYEQQWRFITNSGQDEEIIRPVIGAKGMPYYPGASMKGAFLRACQEIAPCRVQDYCGGELEDIPNGKKHTKPGILRFHGGYPIDMSWANIERLLDIVHPQQEHQVQDDLSTGANVQISLYKTKFRFGISQIKSNADIIVDWDLVKKIWEHALFQGIGSRTSAGYGHFTNSSNTFDKTISIISVKINGTGISSTLLNKTHEFRPNMFKAALRGHTSRLLAGVTNEEHTQELTQKLWGWCGKGEKGPIVGKFGIKFEGEVEFSDHKYNKVNLQYLYNLKSGTLNILKQHSQGELEKEIEFLDLLIKFSLLLGGFGKSWRRVDHSLFYPSYFSNRNKPMIGCHWYFSSPEESAKYCITAPRDELTNIQTFLAGISDAVRHCFNLPSTTTCIGKWREVWHPDKVQVWGRIANQKSDSKAVLWFHQDDFIKKTELTGCIKPRMVGTIWHRMYPLYVKKSGQMIWKKNTDGEKKYVELLTIFTPQKTDITEKFLGFLKSESSKDPGNFQKLFGN
ncbi:MAG: hypothetical protein VKL02_07575 [Cylindrospermopsis raciborskii 1523720]|uniref:hypothetical protein n=1 Tax=Cylindrospermopsis raciborskii TaxID=77022 RepID=UPI002B459E00|nr:hypothetical protein [Cylindrospermopsis raciborskii]MEB3145983.1 hypothetical protein [Cylindrospermopsis raciborskii]